MLSQNEQSYLDKSVFCNIKIYFRLRASEDGERLFDLIRMVLKRRNVKQVFPLTFFWAI